MREAGADIKATADIMGHHEVGITLNTYTDASENFKMKEISLLENGGGNLAGWVQTLPQIYHEFTTIVVNSSELGWICVEKLSKDQNPETYKNKAFPSKTKGSAEIGKPSMVGRGGFEPPKSVTTDLQSVPFGRSGIFPY